MEERLPNFEWVYVERNSVTWKSCGRVPIFEKYFRFSRTPGLCTIFTVNSQVPSTMIFSAPIWTTSKFGEIGCLMSGSVDLLATWWRWEFRLSELSGSASLSHWGSFSIHEAWMMALLAMMTMVSIFTATSHLYPKRLLLASGDLDFSRRFLRGQKSHRMDSLLGGTELGTHGTYCWERRLCGGSGISSMVVSSWCCLRFLTPKLLKLGIDRRRYKGSRVTWPRG